MSVAIPLSNRRVLVALVVAPLATPFVLCTAWTAMGPRPVTAAFVLTQLIVVAIYGLPVAYLAELSIGYLTWKAFLAFGIRSHYAFLVAGVAIGIAPMIVFRDPINMPAFALAGAVSSLVFRAIALRGARTT